MNPYDLLGLEKDCTDEDITKSFRNLSKTHHPDVGGDSEVFIQINIAVSVLRNPYKRKLYDDHGICDGMSEDNTKGMVMMKFQELINSWIDNQLHSGRDINIVEFFKSNLDAAKRNLDAKINDSNKQIKTLNRRLKRVSVKDGERNLVAEMIQARIDELESTNQHMRQELLIVEMIKEESDKYSSEEEIQNMSSHMFETSSTSTGPQFRFFNPGM